MSHKKLLKKLTASLLLLGLISPVQANDVSVNTNHLPWTNKSITITITGDETANQADGYAQSGVASVLKPDGTTVTKGGSKITSDTHTAIANGTYTARVTDQAGNVSNATTVIGNIDKVSPVIGAMTLSNTNWTNQPITVTAPISDALSGLWKYSAPGKADTIVSAVPANSTTKGAASATASFSVATNGTYTLTLYDVAGNLVTKDVAITKIDTVLPTVARVRANDLFSNTASYTITASDDASGIASVVVTKPDSTNTTVTLTGGTGTFIATANGNYTITVTDAAGNVATTTFTETKIDNVAPDTPVITSVVVDQAASEVTITWDEVVDTGSGLKDYLITYNGKSMNITETSITLPISEFKDVTVSATDIAGNASAAAQVENIKIQSVIDPAVINGVKLMTIDKFTLPTTVEAVTNYGNFTLAAVWDTSAYDKTKSVNTLSGSLQLVTNVLNPSNVQPTLTIQLEEFTLTDKDLITNFPYEPAPLHRKSTLLLIEPDLSSYATANVLVNGGTDSIDLPIAWDLSPVDLTVPDAYKITGYLSSDQITIDDSIDVKMYVDVTEPDLTSIANVSPITVDAFTTFDEVLASLPTTLDVAFENGMNFDCNVTWLEGTFTSQDDTFIGTTQVIRGEIELPEYYTNLSAKTAAVLVTVEKATIDLTESDSALNQDMTVEYNTSIDALLPETITLTFTNGKTLDVGVTYDLSTYDRLVLGKHTVQGILDDPGLFTTGVQATVVVDVLDTHIASVVTPNIITKPAFTQVADLNLPTEVIVDYTNGETSVACPVTWDTSAYDSTSLNQQYFTGTFNQPYGYQGTTNVTVSIAVSLSPAKITAVETLNYDVDYGTSISEINVPTEVEVEIENGLETLSLPVIYNVGAYEPTFVGRQQLTGTIDIAGHTIANTDDLTSLLFITVSQLDLTSVAVLPDITADTYTPFDALGLPQLIEALFVNGVTGTTSTLDCQVTWDKADYSETKIDGPQTIRGTIAIPEGMTNTGGFKATTTVTLNRVVVTEIAELLPVDVIYGTQIADVPIPSSVEITIPSSGNTVNIPILFDTTGYKPMQLGTQTFTGTLDTSNPYIDFSGLTAPDLIIRVTDATVTEILTEDFNVIGKLGDKLNSILPASTEVTVRLDSGISYKVQPTWNFDDYDDAIESQTLEGILELPDATGNPLGLKAKMHITLEADPANKDVIIKAPDLPIINIARGTEIANIPYVYQADFLFGDGKTRTLDIAYWDSSAIDTSVLGEQTAVATLLPEGFRNPNGIVLKQKVKVVDVGSTNIAQILPLPPIEVLPGEKVTLPTVVDAILGNGETVKVPVTFNPSTVNPTAPGVIYVPGTITSNNPLDLKPIQEIDVIDLFATDRYITKVLDSDTIYGPLGSMLNDLPINNSIRIRLSDNRWTVVSPTYNTSSYNNGTTSLQAFKATLITGTGYTNPYNLGAYLRIKLYDIDDVDNLSITKIFNPSEVTVVYDTPYTQLLLPNPRVQLSNNIVTPIRSPWSVSSYNQTLVGKQTIVEIPAEYNNPSNLEAILVIRVLPDSSDATGERTIVSIADPSTIKVVKGTSLSTSKLAKTVTATLRNGSTTQLPATWDYTTQKVQSNMSIDGQASIPTGMLVTCALDAVQEVVTTKAPSDDSSSGSGGGSTPTVQPTTQPIETPNPNVEKEALKKEQAIIDSASAQVPYTLPGNKTINWKQFIDCADWTKLSITPTTFGDEMVVDVNLKTAQLSAKMKAKIVKPDATVVTSFSDVASSHWAYSSIMNLSQRGYIKGTSDNTFNPKDKINVADTFAFMDRILVNNSKLRMKNTRDVVDGMLPYSDHWSYYNVASILSRLSMSDIHEIINFSSDIYKQEMTREKVAYVLHSILTTYDVMPGSSQIAFNDAMAIKYSEQVSYCVSLGLFFGDTNGDFNPAATITRAELVSVLIRLDDLLKQ